MDSDEKRIVKGRVPPIEHQREFWDSPWQQWKERKVLNAWTERRATAILDLIADLPTNRPRILDLGCGNGWFTERLADIGEAHGLDLSNKAIAMAQERRPDIRYLAGNAYTTELEAGSFDLIVSQEVIAHVEDQPRYIARAAEILKSRGYLIITTGNKFVMDRLGDVGWNVYPSEHIEHELTRNDLKRLLRPNFELVSLQNILPHGSVGIMRLINSHKLNSLAGKIMPREKIDRLKERVGFGWQMIALARKKS